MARGPSGNADKLSALITEIEAEAYARGQADARKELLDLLGAGPEGRGVAGRTRAKPAKPAAPKRRASSRKRAPKGSVPRFVEQALRDRPGQTPQEVLARAASDMERLIKLASIRTELRNGRQQGKYQLNAGRWSLAPSDAGRSPSRTMRRGHRASDMSGVSAPQDTEAQGDACGATSRPLQRWRRPAAHASRSFTR